MAQLKALPQSKEALLKSYNKRLKDDIKSMIDNFVEIVKLARPPGEEDNGNVIRPLSTSQDQCEMHVRAANIAIKPFRIFSTFQRAFIPTCNNTSNIDGHRVIVFSLILMLRPA
ncbi:UNVERIFIED_CONTAM: Med22 [Trichonephila clavipes]